MRPAILQPRRHRRAPLRPRNVRPRALCGFVTIVGLLLVSPGHAARAGATRRPVDALPFIDASSAPAAGQGGVGMVLSGKNGKVVIGKVVPGGPAARAGVLAGDVVVEVDGWRLPADVESGKVAARIRGKVGTRCSLTVRRTGAAAPVGLAIVRGSMASLFPQVSSRVLQVEQGLALLAVAGHQTVGVRFHNSGSTSALIEYEWAIQRGVAPLGDRPERSGVGAVSWSPRGATIQVGQWRLELAPRPVTSAMIVRSSTLPVAVVGKDRWRSANPQSLTYVRPRNAPRPYRQAHAGGPCKLKVQATVDGKPAAGRRLTLWLVKDGREGLPSASTITDDSGRTTLQVPTGAYRATGLHASLNGGERDLYYGTKLHSPVAEVRCPAGGGEVTLPIELVSTDKPPRPVALSLPTSAATHPLVGKRLPDLEVRAWHGDHSKLPKRLRKKAMLMYVWATWCGPCKRVSPLIAELNAEMAGEGLVVVSASVDRDGNQLRDFAEDQLPGAAPIAWLGPTAMNKLKVSGIPTVFAVDSKGIVRAVHTGTGVGLKAWRALVKKLLAER